MTYREQLPLPHPSEHYWSAAQGFRLRFAAVHRDSANRVRISARGLFPDELDSFIDENILFAVIGLVKLNETSVFDALFKSSDKTNAHAAPISELLRITVAAVRNDDSAALRLEAISFEIIVYRAG